MSELPGHLKAMVVEDSVLWLRTLLLYAVSQTSLDASSGFCSPRKKVTARGVAGSGPPTGHEALSWDVSPPEGLQDPVSLAQWALQQAAQRLAQGLEATAPTTSQVPLGKVSFVWEHPRDPKEYMDSAREPSEGWPSWWAFPEWHRFRDIFGIHEARCDQGKLGHVRPKPSTVATTSWILFEALEGQLLSPTERASFGRGPGDVLRRIQASGSWACWAPGLVSLVLQAWTKWGIEQGLWSEVSLKQCLLARMSEEESFRRHVANNHTPFKKGCPVCIAAQGRRRSHWRSSFTGLYALSCDLAGPFVAGQGYDPVASGRDKGQGYKYFLACAYTLPIPSSEIDASDKPHSLGKDGDIKCEGDEQVIEPVLAPDIPEMEELFPPDEDDVMGKAVTHRLRSKRSEHAPPGEPPKKEPLEDPPLPPPKEPPPFLTRTLCVGVPLRSKKGREVLPAVQSVVNKLEAAGFPVQRYHADRAKELRSAALVGWLRSSGIHATWTPGDSPAGNKAELAVQQLNSASRKLLAISRLGASFWPLAVLHASNRNWHDTCEALGIPQPLLLPFGISLQARKRVITGYPAHWVSRTVSATYMGQAPHNPGGDLVWVPDEKGGHKVMLTNTVYPVAPHAPTVRPRFRVVGKKDSRVVAVKTVAMWDVSHLLAVQVPQAPPGGVWASTAVRGSSAEMGIDNFDVDDGQEPLEGVSSTRGQVPQEDVAEGMDKGLPWDEGRCLELLTSWEASRNPGLIECDELWESLVFGLEATELSTAGVSQGYPVLIGYLNAFLKSQIHGGHWTSLRVGSSLDSVCNPEPAEDSEFAVWIVALGKFQGGGVWIGSDSDKGSVLRMSAAGFWEVGSILDMHGQVVEVPKGRRRLVDPWIGKEVWALNAFVHVRHREASGQQLKLLRDLGFQVPGGYPKVGQLQGEGALGILGGFTEEGQPSSVETSALSHLGDCWEVGF